MDFITAYLLTITIETTMIYYLLNRHYKVERIVKNSVIASSITLPFVWFFFPNLGFSWQIFFIISETFAILIEGLFYHLEFRELGWKHAFFVSALCNLTSSITGLVLS